MHNIFLIHDCWKWKLWQTCQKRKFKTLKNKTVKILLSCFFYSQLNGQIQNEQNILQYQSILQNPLSILIQPVELFSVRWAVWPGSLLFGWLTSSSYIDITKIIMGNSKNVIIPFKKFNMVMVKQQFLIAEHTT